MKSVELFLTLGLATTLGFLSQYVNRLGQKS